MLPYAFAGQLPPQVPAGLNFPMQNQLLLERFRFPGMPAYPFGPYGALDPTLGYRCLDPRARFVQEEPKPQHSYIGLIAMAILSHPDKKLVLSDIYQWILDNYPYFRARGPGWRNSIRHNLSLNDCFVKAGRSANGKGHYWAIHPANVDDFKKGDFRRRRAQRKVRKAMGLVVPDDDDEDDDDSPALTPPGGLPVGTALGPMVCSLSPTRILPIQTSNEPTLSPPSSRISLDMSPPNSAHKPPCNGEKDQSPSKTRRMFDVESLLSTEKNKSAAPKESKKDVVSPAMPPASPGAANTLRQMPFAALGPFGANPFAFQNLLTSYLFPPNSAGLCQLPIVPPHLLWAAQAGAAEGLTAPVAGDGDRGVEQSPSPTSAAQWQESFAKIMARSYQGKQIMKDIAGITPVSTL